VFVLRLCPHAKPNQKDSPSNTLWIRCNGSPLARSGNASPFPDRPDSQSSGKGMRTPWHNGHRRLGTACGDETGGAPTVQTLRKKPSEQRLQSREGDFGNRVIWYTRRLGSRKSFDNPKRFHHRHPATRQNRLGREIPRPQRTAD